MTHGMNFKPDELYFRLNRWIMSDKKAIHSCVWTYGSQMDAGRPEETSSLCGSSHLFLIKHGHLVLYCGTIVNSSALQNRYCIIEDDSGSWV